MSTHAESVPVTLIGGPMDGMELDVTPDTDEVRRAMPIVNRTAIYKRQGKRFVFVGYEKL